MQHSSSDSGTAVDQSTPAVLKRDAAQQEDESTDVGARTSPAPCVDVHDIEGVSWDSEAELYKVEYRIPPIKQDAVTSNPLVQAQLNIERRANGVYVTQHTESADTAHAISRFMKLLWEGNF